MQKFSRGNLSLHKPERLEEIGIFGVGGMELEVSLPSLLKQNQIKDELSLSLAIYVTLIKYWGIVLCLIN